MEAYNNRLERQYKSHRIQERLTKLLSQTSASGKRIIDQHTTDQIHAIHNEMDEYKTNAESKCRKITKPSLPYSPTSSFWYDQIHAYRTLIRIKTGAAGPGTDISRAIRTALRKKIPNPRRWHNAGMESRQHDSTRRIFLTKQLMESVNDTSPSKPNRLAVEVIRSRRRQSINV